METRNDILSSLEADHDPVQKEPQAAAPTWEQIQAERDSYKQQLDNAQRLVGEQGRQLGEYRSLLTERQEAQASQSQSDLSDDDFITSPKSATERLLEQKLKRYEEKLSSFENDSRVSSFKQKHPDAEQLLQSQEFISWANTGPYAYMAGNAARGDLEAADALIRLYKETKPKETSDRGALAAASTERSSGTAATSSKRKPISREKYRQALMRGEKIPAEVMAELQEAYRNKNFV